MILATDGLWDYLSDQEAVEIVASCMPTTMDSATPHTLLSQQKAREYTDKAKWELLAAEKLVNRALEIAAEESGMTLAQMKELPIGRSRRGRHDDTTAVVMYF